MEEGEEGERVEEEEAETEEEEAAEMVEEEEEMPMLQGTELAQSLARTRRHSRCNSH